MTQGLQWAVVPGKALRPMLHNNHPRDFLEGPSGPKGSALLLSSPVLEQTPGLMMPAPEHLCVLGSERCASSGDAEGCLGSLPTVALFLVSIILHILSTPRAVRPKEPVGSKPETQCALLSPAPCKSWRGYSYAAMKA